MAGMMRMQQKVEKIFMSAELFPDWMVVSVDALSFMGLDPLHPPSPLPFIGQLFTYECATEVHRIKGSAKRLAPGCMNAEPGRGVEQEGE